MTLRYPDDYIIKFSGRRGESLLAETGYGNSPRLDEEAQYNSAGIWQTPVRTIRPVERGPVIRPEVKRKGSSWRRQKSS